MCETPWKRNAHGILFWKILITVRFPRRLIFQNSVLLFLADEYEQANQKLEARVYQTLQLQVVWCSFCSVSLCFLYFLWMAHWIMHLNFLQVWTMLPGFCTCPVDLLSSFKGIARTLGMAINERPDLRLTVCQALRTLINKSCSTGTARTHA